MSAENMLKRSILAEKGWTQEGETFSHPDRNYAITETELERMTVEELKERIA